MLHSCCTLADTHKMTTVAPQLKRTVQGEIDAVNGRLQLLKQQKQGREWELASTVEQVSALRAVTLNSTSTTVACAT